MGTLQDNESLIRIADALELIAESYKPKIRIETGIPQAAQRCEVCQRTGSSWCTECEQDQAEQTDDVPQGGPDIIVAHPSQKDLVGRLQEQDQAEKKGESSG